MQSPKQEKIQNQINEYVAEAQNTVEKGSKFLEWILLNVFDKAESELDDDDISSESGVMIIDGSGDKGIDAVFVYKASLFIIQSKYGTSHSEDAVHAFVNKMTNLFGGSEKAYNSKIKIVRDLIFDDENSVIDIQLFYITDNKIDSNIFNFEINRFEDQALREVGKNCRMKIMGIQEIIDYQDEMANAIPNQFKGTKANLIIEQSFENNEHTTIVAEVALKNLARFVDKNRDYLYYSNIRNFLGKSGKINKTMVQTFKDSPKSFWYYNNGITIVCDNYIYDKDIPQLEITTPQIVNGCQTASVIYNEWKNIKDKQKQNSQEGTILVKIIKDTNNKRVAITRYTNSQNAVSGKDFFALEAFHKELKKAFEEYGHNYEIQRNAGVLKNVKSKIKGNANYKYLFDTTFCKKNTIIAKEAVQSYVAGILLKPAKSKKIGDFVPGGQYYDETFNEKTPSDPRCYLFPYAVTYYGKNILLHKKDDRQKASNLLFTTVYFRLLLAILKKIGVVTEEAVTFQEISGFEEILDVIFKNANLNKRLLEYADQILTDQIFDDTAISEMIGDNLPKFLKNTVENQKCTKIIIDKIENRINKPNMQGIIEEIKCNYEL